MNFFFDGLLDMRGYKGGWWKVGCIEFKRRVSGIMRLVLLVLLFLGWVVFSGGRIL